MGSLYIFLASNETLEDLSSHASTEHCNGSIKEVDNGHVKAHSRSVINPDTSDERQSLSNSHEESSIDVEHNEMVPTTTQATFKSEKSHQTKQSDAGKRRAVANMLMSVGNYIGTAAPNRFDDSEFKHGKALDFPEIPGEEHRNSALPKIRDRYNQSRDMDSNVTPLPRELSSRPGSFVGSVVSGRDIESELATPIEASPYPPQSPRAQSPLPSPITSRRPRASTLPAGQASFQLRNPPSSSSHGSDEGSPLRRRDTLEVPSITHHHPLRNEQSASSSQPFVTVRESRDSPAIVVSPDMSTSPPPRLEEETSYPQDTGET